MEELFNKLNSKFTAYNWNKVSGNNETTEKIKQEILEIISNQLDKPVKPACVNCKYGDAGDCNGYVNIAGDNRYVEFCSLFESKSV